MSKYVLIPDSFKGTLSSADICRIAAEEILRLEPPAEVCAIPVADGGEGTVDAFLAAVGGRRIEAPCTGPWGEPVTAHYALLPDGTAVVEMAAAAGLPLAGDACDPEKTTTYGVGQLMAHALSHGAVRLVLGLGGSATNDGGCGAAAALGAEFLDEQGSAFVPVGGTLTRIARIRTETLRRTLGGVPVTVMCDIDNPLCGPEGAAAVFGPQKGADAAMVARLDAGLRHLAQVLARDLGMEVLTLSGGGAAGGFAQGPPRFSAVCCAWASTRCWIRWTLTGAAGVRGWSSPARGIWTARACGARRSSAWPGVPRRWAFLWRRWRAAAKRRWTRSTRRGCPGCSPSTRRPAHWRRRGGTDRRTCGSPWAICCGSWRRWKSREFLDYNFAYCQKNERGSPRREPPLVRVCPQLQPRVFLLAARKGMCARENVDGVPLRGRSSVRR